MSSLGISHQSATILNSRNTSPDLDAQTLNIDSELGKLFGGRVKVLKIKEMEPTISVEIVLATPLEKLNQRDVTFAIRSFFHHKPDLSDEDLQKLSIRVRHLPDSFSEKAEFFRWLENR